MSKSPSHHPASVDGKFRPTSYRTRETSAGKSAKVIWQRPHRNHGKIGTTVYYSVPWAPNRSSIRSAVFSQRKRMKLHDRQTDRRPGSPLAIVRMLFDRKQLRWLEWWQRHSAAVNLEYIFAQRKQSYASQIKKSFYRAANTIFGKIGCLFYGLEACPLTQSDIKSLNFVINRSFYENVPNIWY